jgi:hypothetical protein
MDRQLGFSSPGLITQQNSTGSFALMQTILL